MKIFIATILTIASFQSFSQCDPSFTYSISQSYVYFKPTDSLSGTNHTWYFGDGNSSYDVYGYWNYNSPGLYQVTHVVYDSLTKCTDSAKQTINLSYTPQCESWFTYESSITNPGAFIFRSLSSATGTTITQYTWKIDGVTVTSGEYDNLSYTFSNPGSYQVCLNINTSAGCSSSYCTTVHVMSACKINSDFSYKANLNNARYIEFEPTPNNPNLRYRWLTDQQQFYGYYEFPQAGKYEVIMFVTDSVKYCYDSVKKVIDVKGNRSDSCTASYSYAADPHTAKQVIFTATSNQPIVRQNWAIENKNGLLDSIIAGSANTVKYQFPDTGYYSVSLFIETNSGCFRTYTDTIHVTNTISNSPRETLTSYPNPANNYLVMPFEAENAGAIQVSVYNSMGKIVLTQQKAVAKGNNQIQLGLHSLTKGQYYVHILYNNKTFKSRFQKL